MPSVRTIDSHDRERIRAFLERRWGGPTIMLDGRAIDAATLPGFIAFADDDAVAGLITLLDDPLQSEIVTLDAVLPQTGLGTDLVEHAAERARALGLGRLLARTTNDNLEALRFYQRRGFRLHRLAAGAIDLEREANPAIALLGRHGIPLRDEISLVRALGAD
jgi:GNAT superfamily N-acetyltransferase